MMTRSPDILFMAEYIKNVLYFATVRQGKSLKSTKDAHYFSIDSELVYENYYADFGPLNLGCVYKYCKQMNEKLKQYLNKQVIVHYTTIDPKKKANAAFLLGCYGVLYLSLSPKDALKPLLVHGQSYRPFQDATQGDSVFTISLLDCLQAIKKAREVGFFDFQDFNNDDYDRLDRIQGGDLNWIVPGKFLAFIGPVDYSVSLYHPPDMYIDYFLENNVKIVIRLNKKLYDGNVFSSVGINHYDLFFPDGSCPPRHILMKFLQISEESECAIAVHCKAGLGRTGSLIGCYLIKHYRMTSHEAIGWMRICRPGSVIGHQQGWLEQLEAWLTKQGNIYRQRHFGDTGHFPIHNYGVYSIAEKTVQQRPVVFQKSPSPPPPMPRQNYKTASPLRPVASTTRDDKRENEDEEIFLTSCDLTIKPAIQMTQMKGCIIRNNTVPEEYDENVQEKDEIPLWKQLICCTPCVTTLKNGAWMMAVRCARFYPESCNSFKLCYFIDMAAANKIEKEQFDRRLKTAKLLSSHILSQSQGEVNGTTNTTRRASGAGEPRLPRSPSRSSSIRSQVQKTKSNSAKSNETIKLNDMKTKNLSAFHPTITTFRTTQGPVIKNVNDAKNFLMRSSKYNDERERHLMSSVTVTPHYSNCTPSSFSTNHSNIAHLTPSTFSTASRGPTQPQQRRRLGRSPSPLQMRMSNEQTRATNTPISPTENFLAKDASKSALREALSRLKLICPRDGSVGAASVGAASLGARRDAPAPKRAPSVRSDERPLATQGDMLNSIKFQRRYRESLHTDKFHEKLSPSSSRKGEKTSVSQNANSKAITGPQGQSLSKQDFPLSSSERPGSSSKNFFTPNRPSSPKGRRSPSFY